MKNIFKGLFIGAAVLGMSACVQESFVQLDIENATAPVLHSLSDYTSVLEEGGDFATFTWDAADYDGSNAAARYTLYASYNGSAAMSVATVDGGTEMTVNADDANAVLMRLGCPYETAIDVDFYLTSDLKSTSGVIDGYTLRSNTISVGLTAYKAEATHAYVYVVGTLNSWSFTGPFLYNYEDDNVKYQGVIDFTEDHSANEFKITDAADWTHGNYGAENSDVGTEPDSYGFVNGSNDNVAAYNQYRYYHFSFDLPSLTIYRDCAFDACTVNVGGTEYDMEYNLAKQRFYVDVEDASGTAIVNLDGSQYYSSDLSVGGQARVYFDFNDLNDISLTANASMYGQDENAGNGDVETGNKQWELAGTFSDWEYIDMKENNGVYIAYGVEASAGDEYGFHDLADTWWAAAAYLANSDWTTDDDGNSYYASYTPTVGEAFLIDAWNGDYGSVNIIIPEDGTYDIYVNPSYNISYLMNAGDVPGTVENTWGIVGTVNGWGATGDFALTQSESNDALWYIKGLPLANEDQIKLRYNNSWDEGDFGLAEDAAYHANTQIDLAAGGDNITITRTGKYDIYFYNIEGVETLWVMDEGYEPGDAVPTWGIIGSVESQGWDDTNTIPMEHIEGYYVYYGLTINNGDEFKFMWDNQGWSGEYDLGGSFSELGAPVTLSYGGSNLSFGGDFADGNYDVYLDVDNLYAYVMEEGELPDPGAWVHVWTIVGSFDDTAWGEFREMTEQSDGMWKITQSFVAGDEFKFAYDAAWNFSYGSSDDVVINGSITLDSNNGANIVIPTDGTYDLYLDTVNEVAYIMDEGKNPDVGTWYYTGSLPECNSWGTNVEMSHDNGYWVAIGVTLSTGDEFKFLRDNSWDVNRGGTFAVDTAIDVVQNGDNITSTVDGTYDLYLDAVNDKAYVMTSGKTPADAN